MFLIKFTFLTPGNPLFALSEETILANKLVWLNGYDSYKDYLSTKDI